MCNCRLLYGNCTLCGSEVEGKGKRRETMRKQASARRRRMPQCGQRSSGGDGQRSVGGGRGAGERSGGTERSRTGVPPHRQPVTVALRSDQPALWSRSRLERRADGASRPERRPPPEAERCGHLVECVPGRWPCVGFGQRACGLCAQWSEGRLWARLLLEVRFVEVIAD